LHEVESFWNEAVAAALSLAWTASSRALAF